MPLTCWPPEGALALGEAAVPSRARALSLLVPERPWGSLLRVISLLGWGTSGPLWEGTWRGQGLAVTLLRPPGEERPLAGRRAAAIWPLPGPEGGDQEALPAEAGRGGLLGLCPPLGPLGRDVGAGGSFPVFGLPASADRGRGALLLRAHALGSSLSLLWATIGPLCDRHRPPAQPAPSCPPDGPQPRALPSACRCTLRPESPPLLSCVRSWE